MEKNLIVKIYQLDGSNRAQITSEKPEEYCNILEFEITKSGLYEYIPSNSVKVIHADEADQILRISIPTNYNEEATIRFISSYLNSDMFNALIHPKEYDYEISEKLFLDLKNKYAVTNGSTITKSTSIYDFLNHLIEATAGDVNVDHYSLKNYDRIEKIEPYDSYLKITFKNFGNKMGKMNEKSIYGDFTSIYSLCQIEKIKFIVEEQHVFVLVKTQMIPTKKLKREFEKDGYKVSLNKYNHEFYHEYVLEKIDEKQKCIVHNLPYYSFLIQPKEGQKPLKDSKKIILKENLINVQERIDKVKQLLDETDEYDYDQIFAQGNTLRRILEYTFKFYCIFREIDLKIDAQYGQLNLGKLKPEINDLQGNIVIEQRLINIANELSHDSGEVFSKEEVIEFWNDVKKLLEQIEIEINR
ncbi:hypothetical protein [Lysinibacillus sp. ACHW1.5]|uniref:hypothetical protein n=1 Tax=Lysinibacillus sp. ACHW1.5 TaxID=2913506 RepID=UPI001EDB9994|nr:hypothetical protein [Lysinibacillus sp. ACHW1.5]UKJ43467.1 hypothetical protein L6W14_11850 [Lysinibacillus sp. ACHW1.5]